MITELLKQLGHYGVEFLATAVALLVIAVALPIFIGRQEGPIEPVGVIELLIRRLGAPSNASVEGTVNVEYRDRSGALMDLGSLIKGRLRNGRGASFELIEGCFVGCDSARIKPGTMCMVTMADGLVKERLRVQVDVHCEILFLTSDFTVESMIEQINRAEISTA